MNKKSMLLAAFFAANLLAGQTAFAEEAEKAAEAVAQAAAEAAGAKPAAQAAAEAAGAKPAAETVAEPMPEAAAEAEVAEPVPEAEAETAEPTAENAAETDPVPASATEQAEEEANAGAADETGEAPADTSAGATGESVGMANPMLEYQDIPSLERSVGFPVFYLPGNMLPLYHPAQHIYSIDRYISDIRFQSVADDSKLTVRTALIERIGTDDISGYYGEWTQESAGDIKRTQVHVARTATGTRVVRWSAGRFCFAFTIEGVDEATFKTMLKNFVSVADRFSHKYRNFRLNYKKAKAAEKPAEATEPAAQETPAAQ